ncbi:amino acid permease [Chitinophaga pollutisoli]|uniref:Amino acid permease n=1 Tax=Chitinophaga pollutisoli TaxID=3133966 RepID=A0ABZ2YPQ7_9BACT
MSNSLFRKKSLTSILNEAKVGDGDVHGSGSLKKVLTVRDLTLMGVAAVIGAGIFSTIGQAAYNGGPAVIFLFILTAVTCGFTALCYAEFASRVPVAGSAYTYSYVTFGEMAAWIIGWALILEYSIGNIVVAISWSSYFNNVLEGIGIHLPAWLATDYNTAKAAFAATPAKEEAWNTAPMLGSWRVILNIPAFLIVILVTILAYVGIHESKRSANLMVGLKIVVLLAVIAIGVFHINTENWQPFMPEGFNGVLMGVSAVFFAYIGFDAISTTAEESANPQRDMPRAMIYSLIICTIIYVIVTLVITGMVHYKEFQHVSDPLAYVFDKLNMRTIGYVISISAVIAATSVILVFQIGQPRIWMSMSRDGLLPKKFAKVHPKYHTPGFSTIITGVIVAIPSLFVESGIVTDLTSIGTLFAFVLVCGGVLLLPKVPKGEKKFNLPYINGLFVIPVVFGLFSWFFWDRVSESFAGIAAMDHDRVLFVIFYILATLITVLTIWKKLSLIPVMGMLCCLYLMIEIPVRSWVVFFGWMAVGLAIYFMYGFWKSKLAAKRV